MKYILSAVAGIIACPTITHCDIQKTVGPEFHHAAIVIFERCGDYEQTVSAISHCFGVFGDTMVFSNTVAPSGCPCSR